MKEIKFKAWDKELQKMITISSLDSKHKFMTWNGRVYENGYLKNYIMLQFIGLHDKDGKEIYDGDIVKDSYYPDNSEYGKEVFVKISFDDDLCCYKGNIFSDRDGIECENIFYIKSDSKRLQIIGNIYQNPELLR